MVNFRLGAAPTLAALCALISGAASAGGIDFSTSAQSADAGPSYIGVATDENGSPLPDAKITVNVKKLNSTVVQRADSQGHFFIQGYDKSVSPNDVDIVCSKTGYKDTTATKTLLGDATAPVQVVCVLQKKA